MNFIVCAYYTKNTIYEEKAQTLKQSLVKYNIPFYLEGIDNLGDWSKNTNYKPTFLKEMLDKFPNKDIVYVDVDAEFFSFPELFNVLSLYENVNVGLYLLDRSQVYKRGQKGFEVLSGTIFLKNNNSKVKQIVSNWILECKNNPRQWDQKSLEKVLNGDFYKLPAEYCCIFDRMDFVKNPVILHYQASRIVRKEGLVVKSF